MSGPHYISASNREVTGRSVAVYLSPGDVAAYRAAMLGAGDVLGGLLSCEFPNADLVSDALYAVTKVVGVYGLEGKWVTSRASGDRSEFLWTSRSERYALFLSLFAGGSMYFVFLTVGVLVRLLCRR